MMVSPKWEVEERNQGDSARIAAFRALEPQMDELENEALNSAFGNTQWDFDPDPVPRSRGGESRSDWSGDRSSVR